MKNYIVMLIMLVALTGCGKDAYKLSEQDIVFVYRELYYADVYENSGFFIDNEGKRYFFDLTADEWGYAENEEVYDYLINNRDSFTAEEFLSQEEIEEWYGYLCAIPPDAEIEKASPHMCGGSRIVFGVRMTQEKEEEIILIQADGLWRERNMDENARKIVELFTDKTFKND